MKFQYCRMWPDGRIPYTFHSSIEGVPERKDRVETALREMGEVSCVEFVDISGYVTDYRTPPPDYPDFL